MIDVDEVFNYCILDSTKNIKLLLKEKREN